MPKNLYLAPSRQIGYLCFPADPQSQNFFAGSCSRLFLKVSGYFKRNSCYGLLAIGNGHAPGTAIGLGAAGIETVAFGLVTWRLGKAGLAVFFFAAFLIAGFLAGFFLPSFLATARLTGTFLAVATLREVRLLTDFVTFFFLRVSALPAAFFAEPRFELFFAAFAIRPSTSSAFSLPIALT